jgi:hypothetical protein
VLKAGVGGWPTLGRVVSVESEILWWLREVKTLSGGIGYVEILAGIGDLLIGWKLAFEAFVFEKGEIGVSGAFAQAGSESY